MPRRKNQSNSEEELEVRKLASRNFATNQSIRLGEVPAIVEGYTTEHIVLVRVYNFQNLDKNNERYLKQFNCLLPNAKASRLYTIDEDELMRQTKHVKQEGKTVKGLKKRPGHK